MDKAKRSEYYKHSMGLDSWTIASAKNPKHKVVMNDGPCGLRKPAENGFLNQGGVAIATCTPAPSALAASFDKKICYQTGGILAKNCLHMGTQILLAPGVNIKRSALCGRNFEYFSEDPFLAGRLAAEYINGLEDNGVSACVKHYAANNKEYARTRNSSEMSLRALNEIYLKSFSYVMQYSTPRCLMTSYNRVNGEYINESDYLINKKLKTEFGFKGIIMSDWGAVSDKAVTIKTGLDLEMPVSSYGSKFLDKELAKGVFSEEDLIRNDEHLDSVLKTFKKPGKVEYDFDKAHKDAVKLAAETLVLAKNEKQYLPFKKEDKVLVIGWFANECRFVGGGSGWVNAYGKTTFIDVLKKEKIDYEFTRGYDDIKNHRINVTELELLKKAYNFDKVILFLGTHQEDETEGRDRRNIELHENQKFTLECVKKVFPHFATVIISGGVLNIEDVYSSSDAVLISYLAGEGQAEAIYRNVFGLHNPCGRLPETWISSLDQFPAYKGFLEQDKNYEYYDEDIYVGYRYFLENRKGFMLPFGYGLSYTFFTYSAFKSEVIGDEIVSKVTVKNSGSVEGSDIVQLYVGKKNSNVYRPLYEFKGFEKVSLKPGESKEVEIRIPLKNLGVYSYEKDTLVVEDGKYTVYLNRNAFDIVLEKQINVKGEEIGPQKSPVALRRKELEKVYDFSTPIEYFLFEGEEFFIKNLKKYIKDDAKFKQAYKIAHYDDGTPIRTLEHNHLLDYDQLADFVAIYNKANRKLKKTY